MAHEAQRVGSNAYLVLRLRREDMEHLNDYQKLDWISFAIQEALNGNDGELMQALELVEALREKETTR